MPKLKPGTIVPTPDVVEAFRAQGSGWQSRMDNALREWLKEHWAA